MFSLKQQHKKPNNESTEYHFKVQIDIADNIRQNIKNLKFYTN